MYDDFDGLGGAGEGLRGFIPTGQDLAQAAQGGVALIAGAAIAKWFANFVADIGLTKTTDEKGVTSYKFKPKGKDTELTVQNQTADGKPNPLGPAQLDSGRVFGGPVMSALPGFGPVLIGLSFYAKSTTMSGNGQVWMASSGLGMIGYGLGHVLKSIFERVNVDYSKEPDAAGAYNMKETKVTWGDQAAAYLPFGGVDTYESNIVISGLGNMNNSMGVRRYMNGLRGFRGLGNSPANWSMSAGAPTFVERLNGRPTQIQPLVMSAGVSSAPGTIEQINGLSAVLM